MRCLTGQAARTARDRCWGAGMLLRVQVGLALLLAVGWGACRPEGPAPVAADTVGEQAIPRESIRTQTFISTTFGDGGREFIDATGRTVHLPDRVRRVYPAGPPAMLLVYLVAREALVGWPQELPAGAEVFVPAPYRDLPRLGRLTGRGGTANLEAVLATHPELVLDYGAVDATTRSLAERVQAQVGLPYVLLDGAFDRMPEALRATGLLLGVAPRGEELAAAAEAILAEARQARRAHPVAAWPRVYLARGPHGLETGGPGCINAEVLERVPAINVAGDGPRRAGLFEVSLEDLLRWQPEIILTNDAEIAAAVRVDDRWATVEAVRRGQIWLAPALPFGWVDRPPSINRLLGVTWLNTQLRPARPERERLLRAQVTEFFQLFYQHTLTTAELDALLGGGLPAPPRPVQAVP